MTAPVGFLDFFVLEASDYVEQLDAQLQTGGSSGPDADALQRVARALRGSAIMAKLPAFAEIASGMERVGRGLRERAIAWDPALRGALVAAVDDCKLLLRNVRAWGPADDSRARARVDELARYAPLRPTGPAAAAPATAQDSYLATEASNIGAGLELLATRPGDGDAAANVLRRVRALRGIASVKDNAPLADVLEAAEQAAQPLERGESALSAERVTLLHAAANLLRALGVAMRGGRPLDPSSAEMARFVAAAESVQEGAAGAEKVVPIGDLFFQDGGPTVVETAPNPPTSPAERFRLEVVSQGEHLHRLVSDARAARDEPSRERVRRALRQALRSLQQAAASFGEREVADFLAAQGDAVVRLDAGALDSLDEAATLLAQPGGATGSLAARLQSLRAGRPTAPAAAAPPSARPAPQTPAGTVPSSVAPFAPVASTESYTPTAMLTPIVGTPIISGRSDAPSAQPTPSVPTTPSTPAPAAMITSAPAVTRRATPGAASIALGDLLDRGIRTLGTLPKTPLSNPVSLAEQPPVEIDLLLYRGRAAIERAREIRDAMRRGESTVDAEALGELFDLLDLALTD